MSHSLGSTTYTAHTQVGSVQVKPYWATLAELFTTCCGARDKDKTQHERLLEEEEDATAGELARSDVLLRWLGLLLSGEYLPDNAQVYAVLFRVAGVIDGLAVSADHGTSKLSDDTAEVLNEVQALLKDIARWFTTPDARIGQRTIPNANSRHQLQRVVFHFRQLLKRASTPSPDTALDTAKDVVPELETVQKSAEQAVEDLRLALYSIAQIALTLVTSDALLDAIRDGINLARDVVADTAQATAEQVASVEQAVRPSEAARNEPAQEQVIELKQQTSQSAADLKQGVQQLAAQAVQVADPASVSAQVQRLPEDLSRRAKDKLPSTDSLLDRFLNVVQDLIEDDDSFRDAVQAVLGLARKYAGAVKTATEGAIPQELVVEAEQHHKDETESALTIDPNLLHLVIAGKELLEGLAGGKSLDPIVDECKGVWSEVKEEVWGAFEEWLQHTSEALQKDDGAASDKAQVLSDSLRELIDNVRDILGKRQDLQERMDHIQRQLRAFTAEIARQDRLQTILRRAGTIGSTFATAVNTHTTTLTAKGQAILYDTLHSLLPSLLTILGSIPLPRIEFTSPQVDAALDDLSLAAINLIPTTVRIEAKESFEFSRLNSLSVNTTLSRVRLEATGLRLALRNVSFFVREKVTQTTSNWLNWICCALPRRRYTLAGREQEGHLGAYREAGLLDLGLFGRQESDEGAAVQIEVERRRDEDQEEDEEEGEPRGFFKVTTATLDLSNSYALRLHKTHHSIINTLLLQPVLSPTTRLVLQHVGQSLLTQGIEKVDQVAWDLHARAKYLAKKSGSSPDVKHYMRVVMDKQAGKSPARLRREKERAEREEEERRQEQERIRQHEEQAGSHEEADGSHSHPKVELKPMAIILNPSSETSISIAAYPSLLPSNAQGAETHRTSIRNTIVRNEWRQRANETAEELAAGASGVGAVLDDVRDTAGKVGEDLGHVQALAGRVGHNARERREIEDVREEGEHDHEQVDMRRGEVFQWYHEGFDL